MHKTGLMVLPFVLMLMWLSGCVPPPPMEEGGERTIEASGGVQLTRAERDSIVQVRHSFGHERWKNRDYEAAIRHFEVVRENDVEHKSNIYRKWADCYNNLGMRDSALYIYEEGIKYFPDDDFLHSSLAIMYRNDRRFDEAIVHQGEAVRLKADSEQYWRDLASLYETVEDWDRAIEAYRRLSGLLPDEAQIINTINSLIRTHRAPDEYLRSLEEVVERFPEDPHHRFDYARALMDQGQNERAAEQFILYTQLRADDPEGWRYLAVVQEYLGRYHESVEVLKKVVELEPESLRDIVAVGRGHLNLKSWTQARAWAQKALSGDGDYGPAWLLMGDIYNKAAEDVGGTSPNYDDKLLFVIAYGLYDKAYNGKDPEAKSNADRSRRILEGDGSLPSQDEWFMRKRYVRPSRERYGWVDHGWPEVNYIDIYLGKYK